MTQLRVPFTTPPALLLSSLCVAMYAGGCASAADPTERAGRVAQTTSALGSAGGENGGPGIDCTPVDDHPVQLGCTGLYSDWTSRTIASDIQPFDPGPGLHLWADGAEKSRWIWLPPGTQIDTTNMDEWVFPVGTRFWKEFRLNGLRVETRLMIKRGDGSWFRTTYAWSQDQSSAPELTTGATNVFGTTYEIPAQDRCRLCHQGRVDNALGFEVVGLSAASATGLTMAALVANGLVTEAPQSPVVIPGDPTDAAALGWLHANCGTACHNGSPGALAGFTGLQMRLNVAQLGSVQATDTFTTAYNVPSGFQPFDGAGFLRITPGSSATSSIPYRDGTRDATDDLRVQMPPFETHVVDATGVALVRAWIDAMPPAPQPN